MIRAGHEQVLSEMLGAGLDLPGGCRFDGGGVEKVVVVARYRCADAVHVLRLSRPDAEEEFSANAGFHLEPAPGFPEPLLNALAARIRDHDASIWETPSELSLPAIAVAAAWLAALIALFVARKQRPPRQQTKTDASRMSPLSLAAALLASALVIVMAARFRFNIDDYMYLEHAVTCPRCVDVDIRIISRNMLFSLGSGVFGDHWTFFAVANLTALAIGAVLWACLVRRLAASRDAAVLATALACMAPGVYTLLRYASGFQQLAINAVFFGVLLLVDSAARVRDERSAAWRRALIACAFALGMTGVLIKYPVLVVLPVSTWIWARWMVPDAADSLRRPWPHLTLGVCLAFVLLLGKDPTRGGELDKLGVGALWSNVSYLAGELAVGWLGGIAAAWLVVAFLGNARSWIWGKLPAPVAARDRAVQSAALLALSIVWVMPFLVNAAYVKTYYLVLPVAPLAALAAQHMSRAAAAVRPAWLAAIAAVPLLVPYRELARELPRRPADEMHVFLDGLRSISSGRAAPRRLIFIADCADNTTTAISSTRLSDYWIASEGGSAFRWATGWYETEVVVEPLAELASRGEADLVVRYCRTGGREILAAAP